MDLTIPELNVQGTAMVTWLHQELARALGEVATLKGQNAILEYKLAQALTPKPPEQPVE